MMKTRSMMDEGTCVRTLLASSTDLIAKPEMSVKACDINVRIRSSFGSNLIANSSRHDSLRKRKVYWSSLISTTLLMFTFGENSPDSEFYCQIRGNVVLVL